MFSCIIKSTLSLFYKFNLDKYFIGDNGNYIRYYNGIQLNNNKNLKHLIIEEIKEISVKTVGRIAPYPVFDGLELENKLIGICYNNNNEPVGLNISFSFYNEDYNEEMYHLGLFLIIPEYQRQGIQKYLGFYTMLYYYLNNYNNELYFTDIGRSPSAFRGLDSNTKCYPTLNSKPSSDFINKCKNIAEYLFNTEAKVSCALAKSSNYDYDTMIISGSNNDDGGFIELIPSLNNKDSRSSKQQKYNDYINEVCNPEDDLIIVFNVNSWLVCKSLIGRILGKL